MSLSADHRLGPYLVVSRLGGGGMGEVWRARDERLGRDVAIKILRTDLSADLDGQRRFAQEARAASALNHPNILTVHDVGMAGGMPFIVTELVDGETLDAVLGRGPLPLAKALEIAVQVAAGLVVAHHAGIVHRDLKPANLMLTRTGLVKILDFGLAKSARTSAADPDATHPGMVFGTASYMSPEQARGDAVDFRSDHFSFGLILYEMLSGRRAFDRPSAVSTLAAIMEEDFEPLAAVKPSLAAPIRWTTERCLSKERERRYADTLDLCRELETVRDRWGELNLSPQASVSPQRRGRLRAVVGVVVAVLAALAAGVAGVSLSVGGVDLERYRLTPIATEGVYEGEPAWSSDGKNLAYVGEVSSVRQVFVRRLGSPAAAPLTRSEVDCRAPFWSPDGSRILYLSHAATAWSLWSIGATGGAPELVQADVTAAAIAPDGRLALLRRTGREPLSLWFAARPGAPPERHSAGPFARPDFGGGSLAFTPDGQTLAAWLSHWNGQSEFWMVPLSGGESRRAFVLPQAATAFHWMPDSRRIVFGGRMPGTTGSDLHLADTRTRVITPLTKTSSEAAEPAPSPDGRSIAFTVGDEDFDLVDVPLDGSPPRNFVAGSRSDAYPSWSPSGAQVAFVTDRAGDPAIWLKSRIEGWERPLVTGADFGGAWAGSFESPRFAPDGQRLAYTVVGSAGHGIYVSNTLGGPPLRLVDAASDQRAPTWSPDGARIAFVENTSGQWSLSNVSSGGNGKPSRIRALPGPCDPDWSPRGDGVACVAEDGLSLVAPDGSSIRSLSKLNWLVHGWSKDSASIWGIVQLADRRRALATVDVTRALDRVVAPLPVAAATEVRGFSLAPDGDRFTTSLGRPRADIWLLEGFQAPGLADRLRLALRRRP